MFSFINVKLIVFVVVLLFETVVSKSLVKYGSSKFDKDPNKIECRSRSTTLSELKQFAYPKVACKGNNDEKFWRMACECATDESGEKPCPKCRISRDLIKNDIGTGVGAGNTETPIPSGFTKKTFLTNGHSNLNVNNRIDVDLPTSSDQDYFNSKLKVAQNITTVSGSANFIRFG